MTEKNKNTIIEQHIDISDEIIAEKTNVLELLSINTGLSKQKLKDAMTKGTVWLSPSTESKSAKVIRRKNAKLKVGNQLSIYYNSDVLAQEVAKPILIADEGDYSVWNKPYGVWSQGSKWGDHCSLGRLVEQHFDFARQSFVVHRLDRAANGLILIAHNKKAAHALAELFASRDLSKIYRATVSGEFPRESIETPMTIDQSIDDKSAISHVSLVSYDEAKGQSLVAIKIETGRKHQIRKHLSSAGFPIIGDRLYGDANKDSLNLQLTAYQLAFNCPIHQQPRNYSV